MLFIFPETLLRKAVQARKKCWQNNVDKILKAALMLQAVQPVLKYVRFYL